MTERLKQIAVGAAGSILTLILIVIWGWVSGGGLIYVLGGVTQVDLTATQADLTATQADLTATKADLTATKDNLTRQEWQGSELIELQGGRSWGGWRGERACPLNHYVCSLEQRVENERGRSEDNTAMNSLRMRCCPLPGVSLITGTAQ